MKRDRLLDELGDARWKLVDAEATARDEGFDALTNRIHRAMLEVHHVMLAVQQHREDAADASRGLPRRGEAS